MVRRAWFPGLPLTNAWLGNWPSLSVFGYLASQGWDPAPVILLAAPGATLAAGLGLPWRRLPRTPAGFALGLGTAFLLLFMFSKKAGCNYYFLVIARLMAGIACASAQFPPDADAAAAADATAG